MRIDTLFLQILLSVYGFFCLALTVIWLFWKSNKKSVLSSKKAISLLIPVRNEATNIIALLKDLEAQTLDKGQFEVIIANDNSDDNTAALVDNFIRESDLNIQLIHLDADLSIKSPKKRAINTCIKLAVGEIIVSTDGDCRINKNWLSEIQQHFETNDSVFLSAPVSFLASQKTNLFSKGWNQMQEIEFASLIVSGACSIKINQANMCSGANIAYLKSAFQSVNGFEGNEHIASGDDEFLMHKMAKEFPHKIAYLKSQNAIVQTAASLNVSNFFNQRRRWAGKWSHYKSLSPKLLALFIFSTNLSLIYAIFTGNLNLALLKLIPEFIFLSASLVFFKKTNLIFLVPILQLIYPFYVVLFGLVSLKQNSYVWKERQLH
jgi:cellulose synthase/poly-beta-1,6-N-acetylglucosamine synthase-like glycosyltransferase